MRLNASLHNYQGLCKKLSSGADSKLSLKRK